MAQDIEQIIQNSKTLKQLTKDISTIAKSSGSSGGGGDGGGLTGVNRIDKKLEDVGDAIKNNQTIKLLSDPVSVIGDAMKGVVKPFTSFIPNLVDQVKKFNPFGKGTGGGKELKKLTNAVEKQSEQIGQLILISQNQKADLSGALEEGLGQSITKQAIQDMKLGKDQLIEVTKLNAAFELFPQFIQGAFIQGVKGIGTGIKVGFNKIFTSSEKQKQMELKRQRMENDFFGTQAKNMNFLNDDNKIITRFLEQGNNQIRGIRDNILFPVANLIGNIHVSLLQIGSQLRAAGLFPEKIDTLFARRESLKDQQQAEQRRDNKLFQMQLFEDLGETIGKSIPDPGGGDEKKKAGGIISWLKKTFGAILGGAVVGATAVGGGIAGVFLGFIKVMTEGFRIIGRRRKMVLRGVAVLAAMGLAVAAFGKGVAALSEGMQYFGLAEAAAFAGSLALISGAVLALGALMSGPQAALTLLGVGLLALLGAAMIPFGIAFQKAGKGLEPAAELFQALSDVKWGDFFIAGPALNALVNALQGFKGLPDLSDVAAGDLSPLTDIVSEIATLPALSSGLNDFDTGLNIEASTITNLEQFGSALQGIHSAVGTGKNTLGNKARSAGTGVAAMIKSINTELNKLNQDALDKLNNLLSNADQLSTMSTNINGAIIGAGSSAVGSAGSGSFVNVNNSQQHAGSTVTTHVHNTPFAGGETENLFSYRMKA